ncbi:MAG: 4Fe-4S dicluster domain-containing protein [Pedosphaera sp.]|nr:4Fe-4S dicluster domain-containing protein [Pedosphaera sp.]
MDGQTHSLLTREIFGNVSSTSKVIFYLLSLAVVGTLAWGIALRARLWRMGKPNTERPGWRIILINLWKLVFLQRRVGGRGTASVAHFLLFGGFVVLSIGTGLIAVEHVLASLLGRGPKDPVFHKGLYFAVYEPVMELAGLALLVGCVLFACRRWKRPPEIGHESRDWLLLSLLVTIGVTGFMLEGLRILREQTPLPGLSFVGAIFAQGLETVGMTASGVAGWHSTAWWLHAVMALALIALFPFSRLLHAIAGTVRLAVGIEPLGTLSSVPIEQVEATGEIGVARVEQFTRRQLVELDACVSCGRCEQACPAFEAGKPLSPRNIVQDIRGHMEATFGWRATSPVSPQFQTGGTDSTAARSLVGGVILPEALWSCTTCSACVDVCPLGVSPLGFIVDMRRFLVADSQLRGSPALALQKTDRTGNPWGMSAQDRMAWATDLHVPTVQENPDCEVIYWVGCAAAYDRRLQKVARSVVKLLRAAGVNFAVLGNLERCTGEAARRMGDELLFQQLAGKNLETFARFGVRRGAKRIVSHCPHCVNSFQQDYPQLGASLDVIHHTEFLSELVRAGRLKIPPGHSAATGIGATTVTYHDPCYLARVQGVTAAPRALLKLASGAGNLVEMPRHGRQTACCGAGGGRMWFDDAPDQRIGRSRVTEAIATGAQTLAVSCPFCLITTADGLAGRACNTAVRDVAEILADGLVSERTGNADTPETSHGF